ncbi:MAG: diphthine synthase [Candidatus Diapherotrites archaeon]|nr:diphthine synthase [Candidatus Diapherotrites archaeon]
MIRMLYLVGIGLKPQHITLEAIEAVRGCVQIFLEDYTSEYSTGYSKELTKIFEKDIIRLGRREIEEGFISALLSANKNNIALLVFGNPLTATTHLQILLDAKENGIKVSVLPGISITNTIAETGLDEYKFGRIVTICYHLEGYEPESFYDQILENQKIGLHTLCLLDIKKDEKPQRIMNCIEAIDVLEKIFKKRNEKSNNNKSDFEYIALIGMASERQKIVFGENKIREFKEIIHIYPQSLIVLGKTNEKEKEALEKLNK